MFIVYGTSGLGESYTMLGSPKSPGIALLAGEALFFSANEFSSISFGCSIFEWSFIESRTDLIANRPLCQSDSPEITFITSFEKYFKTYVTALSRRKVQQTKLNARASR